MKKIFSLIIISLAWQVATASGTRQVVVSNLKLAPISNNSKVDVSFRISADKRAAGSDYAFVLSPVLTNGSKRVVMQPIVIQGKRARISDERREMSRRPLQVPDGFAMANGSSADYKTQLTYEPWMEGAQVILEKQTRGCCSTQQYPSQILAQSVVIVPYVAPAVKGPQIKTPPVVLKTTGDMLAETKAYVAPISKYPEPENRDQSLTIYYRVSKSAVIERDFRENGATLDELTATLRKLEKSNDSRVVRIVISGYASPEGSLALNKELGLNRAKTLQSYVLANTTKVTPDMTTIINGGEDWDGLRKMVAESNMQYKQEVLNIIDTVPVTAGRQTKLMQLRAGDPYRYMSRTFFPDLRNACYVKIYYENIESK